MKPVHDFKVKVPSFDFCSDYNSSKLGDGDLVAAGFSWPPRSYICSFCKREFRSAQALGGHMNVHRRDRARLRQSPTRDGGSNSSNNGGQFSMLNLNLEPNPSFYPNPSSNPSPSFFPSSPPPPVSSLLTKFPRFTSKLPPLGPPPTESKRSCGGDAAPVQNCRPVTTDLMRLNAARGLLGGVERFKNQEFVRLDLEIGLIRPSKEELDLELRLGYT